MIGTRIYHSSQEAKTDATWVAVSFNSDLSDPNTVHSTATNSSRVIIGVGGTYAIAFHVSWTLETAAGVGTRGLRILKNSSVVATDKSYAAFPNTIHWTHSMSCIDRFSAGDIITAEVYQENSDLLGAIRSVGWNTHHLTLVGPRH